MKIVILILTLTLSASAQAPQWVRVATEGQTVVFGSLPITVRLGAAQGTPVTLAGSFPCSTAGGCWTPPLVIPAGSPITVTATLALFAPDPDPILGTVKELDVLKTSVAQSVTVNGVKIPIAAPPPPSPTVYKITLATGGVLTLTIDPVLGTFTLEGTGIQVTKQ